MLGERPSKKEWRRGCGGLPMKAGQGRLCTHVSGSRTACAGSWWTGPADFGPARRPHCEEAALPAGCSGHSESAGWSLHAGSGGTSGESQVAHFEGAGGRVLPPPPAHSHGAPYLCDLLRGDLDGMLLLTAVVQCGSVHVLVVQAGELLHLLPYPCDVILNLPGRCMRRQVGHTRHFLKKKKKFSKTKKKPKMTKKKN